MTTLRCIRILEQPSGAFLNQGFPGLGSLFLKWVEGFGFRFQDLGFRIQDLGFRIQGSGFRV